LNKKKDLNYTVKHKELSEVCTLEYILLLKTVKEFDSFDNYENSVQNLWKEKYIYILH